jgi:hypothetical protein
MVPREAKIGNERRKDNINKEQGIFENSERRGFLIKVT